MIAKLPISALLRPKAHLLIDFCAASCFRNSSMRRRSNCAVLPPRRDRDADADMALFSAVDRTTSPPPRPDPPEASAMAAPPPAAGTPAVLTGELPPNLFISP